PGAACFGAAARADRFGEELALPLGRPHSADRLPSPAERSGAGEGKGEGVRRRGTGHRLQGGDRTSVTGVAEGDALEGLPTDGPEERIRTGRAGSRSQRLCIVPAVRDQPHKRPQVDTSL